MRKKVLAITALVCLVAAGAALAATTYNSYTGSKIEVTKAAGTKSAPKTVKYIEVFEAKNASGAKYPYPLTNIKTTLKDVKTNAAYFPKCTISKLDTASSNNEAGTKVCKTSEVASGTVDSSITASGSTSTAVVPTCKLTLQVFNLGSSKLGYQFSDTPSSCGGTPTSAAKPWEGTAKDSGTTFETDTTLPADISTDAGGIGWGALKLEKLTFITSKVKHAGKDYSLLQSVGCPSSKKRAYTITFTASNGSAKQSKEVKGSAAC